VSVVLSSLIEFKNDHSQQILKSFFAKSPPEEKRKYINQIKVLYFHNAA